MNSNKYELRRIYDSFLRGDNLRSEDQDVLQNLWDGESGFALPDEYQDDFTVAISKENVFRRLGTVCKLYKAQGKIVAVTSLGTAAWVKPGQNIPESADGFAQFKVENYKLAALTRLREEFIVDMDFDLQGYLSDTFARRFGRIEEEYCITGTGNYEPTGILNDAGAEVGVTVSNATMFTFDDLVKLYFSLKKEYRQNAVFLMNDATAFAIRTLKDLNGLPLFNTETNTVLGKPVCIVNAMPDMAAGTKSIAFGDLSYYWIIERQSLSIKRLKELYSPISQVGFMGSERLDGKLIRPEAIKVMKMGA